MNAVLNVIILQFVYEYSLYRSLRSCPIVHVLYIWCRDPVVENRDFIALKKIVVSASWRQVGEEESGEFEKISRRLSNFVQTTIKDP